MQKSNSLKSGTGDGTGATITITLPTAVVAKIREVGRNKGCDESSVLKDALSIYLDNWEWYDVLLNNMGDAGRFGSDEVERLIDEYRDEIESESQ